VLLRVLMLANYPQGRELRPDFRLFLAASVTGRVSTATSAVELARLMSGMRSVKRRRMRRVIRMRGTLMAGLISVLLLCESLLSVRPALAIPTRETGCGEWRWPVKTLSDHHKREVHFSPMRSTVTRFRRRTPPSDLGPTKPRTTYVEFHTWTLRAVTYSEAVSQLGTLQVLGMNLIVDSGTVAKPEVVDLTNATVGVGGATPYSETFTPQPASALSPVCPTDQATIKITKTDGQATGDVNEPLSIQPQDNNGIFRIVDCKYMYNLATGSLSGVGTYKVYAIINGVQATNPAVFDLK
jgi:hypothetical protein